MRINNMLLHTKRTDHVKLRGTALCQSISGLARDSTRTVGALHLFADEVLIALEVS